MLVLMENQLRQVRPHVNRVLVMREGRIVDARWVTDGMLDAVWLARLEAGEQVFSLPFIV
jgi:energy-coupling factor transporter ATP-binding protein EcfA2